MRSLRQMTPTLGDFLEVLLEAAIFRFRGLPIERGRIA